MNIIEALKLNRQLRRPEMGRHWGANFWINPNNILHNITKEDVMADDWEVQPEIVEISREEYFAAVAEAAKLAYTKPEHYSPSEDYSINFFIDKAQPFWEAFKKHGKLK
jgi:hypothetical protein